LGRAFYWHPFFVRFHHRLFSWRASLARLGAWRARRVPRGCVLAAAPAACCTLGCGRCAARNCCQCNHSPRLRTMQAQPATADQAQPATADHATIYLFHWPLGPSRWTTNRFFWFVNQLVSCLLILNASFVTSSRRYAGDSVGSAGGGHALDEAASERSR
jgi:hypothetical protein